MAILPSPCVVPVAVAVDATAAAGMDSGAERYRPGQEPGHRQMGQPGIAEAASMDLLVETAGVRGTEMTAAAASAVGAPPFASDTAEIVVAVLSAAVGMPPAVPPSERAATPTVPAGLRVRQQSQAQGQGQWPPGTPKRGMRLEQPDPVRVMQLVLLAVVS